MNLVARVRSAEDPEFVIHRPGQTSPVPLSDRSLRKLLSFMVDLDLLRLNSEMIEVEANTRQSLNDDDSFANRVSSSAQSYLSKHGITLPLLRDATESIQLPRVRDAPTILATLKEKKPSIAFDESDFTRILFLMASAQKRARRYVRAFYDFPERPR